MDLVDRLLRSDEPSIRLQVRRGVLGASEAELADLREKVRRSSRVATLLSERNADGTISALAEFVACLVCTARLKATHCGPCCASDLLTSAPMPSLSGCPTRSGPMEDGTATATRARR